MQDDNYGRSVQTVNNENRMRHLRKELEDLKKQVNTVILIFDYITPTQNSINFSNLEGWAVFNEVLSGQKYLYRSTLILPATKNTGDARLNVSGFGQMSLSGTVDGTTKNAFAKLYEWQ